MKDNLPFRKMYGRWLSLLILFISSFASAQNIDFGKSYINVTKGLNGGTLETGDTLEIRAAFVVRSGTYDSCGYTDAIPAGTTYIPNTVRVLTNEGKIYKQFTDAQFDDEGWRNGTAIRINLGYNQAAAPATSFRRGRVANTHRPSFFNSSCIMIASFRVKVTASLGSIISTGGGSMTYKSGTNAIQTHTFPNNYIAVYTNYGICSNAVGTNALGTENNGTFGAGASQHRGASTNVPPSYTYSTFTANTPNDYTYSIANNTSNSGNFSTSNGWAKPDNSTPSHRVFSVWDIIGDHTNAASPTAGNAPGNNSSPTAGYMLVINASYRIDSAFQQTITNLCPNTYYEISCWMRNICSRCGCDSAGRGAGNAGYLPTATADSSGVYPNITFEVNGIDYYTTGNIRYTGQWIKKGFTFLTGPTQTSFTLKFFNNAPGGGGNDWALDDISVATCTPNLTFTPSNQPTVCVGNVVDLGCYVRSYFDNYRNYKWQKSTNNGVSWSDMGAAATGTPAWNGSNAWEYFVTYPTFVATMADSGTKYRVVVASTSSNLTNANCAFSETSSVVTLNVINCGVPLNTDILSFTGKLENGRVNLNWTTDKETEPLQYLIEKSTDGRNFTTIDRIAGHQAPGRESNFYSWSEAYNGNAYYRIQLVNTSNGHKYSRIVRINRDEASVHFVQVPNPFTTRLLAEISAPEAQQIRLLLIDNSGKTVRTEAFTLSAGTNRLEMANTASLPQGIYVLRLEGTGVFENRRVVKR